MRKYIILFLYFSLGALLMLGTRRQQSSAAAILDEVSE